MKKVFYILILLIIGSNVNIYSQTDYMKNRFTIGTYNFVMSPGYRTAPHLQNYNDLLFNAHLSFTYRGDGPSVHDTIDGYIVNPSIYIPTFSEALNNLYMSPSDFHKQKVYFERAKVIRGALGQRSTYEAENYGTYHNKKPGYGYQSSETGIDYTNDPGTNVNGRMCAVGTHSAGYIVKDLYENMEQINNLFIDNSGKTDMQFFWSDKKDDQYFWVVKPRMRIRVEDFNDLGKREWPVIRIDVKDYLGNIIYSYDIKVKEFGDYFQNYNGEYKEDFYIYQSQTNYFPKLYINANVLNNSTPANRDLLSLSQVDYSVHWYGNVDVWLDYVRLDDEWAHYLFTDPLGTAPGNNEFMRFHQKIAEEIAALNPAANEGNGFGYFYLDEYAYNNYPCIAKVNDIIKNSCPNTGLVAMDAEFALVGPDALRNPPFDGSFYDT